MVEELKGQLRHLCHLLEARTGWRVREIPGAGAAGGMAAVLLALTPATPRSGIELVLAATGFAAALAGADLVITGVARAAAAAGVPMLAISGAIGPGAEGLHSLGVGGLVTLVPGPMGLEEAMVRAAELLADRRPPRLHELKDLAALAEQPQDPQLAALQVFAVEARYEEGAFPLPTSRPVLPELLALLEGELGRCERVVEGW